mmetsp:Transcript_133067/g.384920  ORF Transcript_133067/g.384920 Transcript_133067/m.384920 type:complete len:474 (-) Transcript_133067:53-1474(-)|eukprot:CAMPEP_0176086552 /NCGR_PEP_ID=MMETSP0120_2-20121206/43325_1 /TAXON_ID=160619 /ORGANISM="Kryptoperidinium foliaceum, Strain CCMP 1326" /LENGTH=473 /DNA_ID=CAMNT_0017420383 /DNA_START=77 /DNA_END=1498 /DNA_ORIENTATION=+
MVAAMRRGCPSRVLSVTLLSVVGARLVALEAQFLDDVMAAEKLCGQEECAGTVSLLQTGIQATQQRSSSMALLQASASSAMTSEVVASAGAHAGDAAEMPTTSASKPGTALLYVLPVLGFALALGAIAVTVFLEVGWPGGAAPSPQKFSEPHMRPFAAGPRLPVSGPAPPRVVRGAEGLLAENPQMGGGFLPPPAQQSQPAPPAYSQAPGPSPMAQDPLVAPAKPVGPQVQIVVPSVPEGGVLGLNLSETDLSVTSFAKPAAKAYGFEVGDRLLAINGIPVAHQDDFVYWLRVAVDRNLSLREPIVFTVFRSPSFTEASQGAEAPGGDEWIGEWEYGDEGATHMCAIHRRHGSLHFEQHLKSGQTVHGALRRTGPSTMEGDLVMTGDKPYSSIRMRLGAGGATAVFNTRKHGHHHWGSDRTAHRKTSAPATHSAAAPGAQPLQPPVPFSPTASPGANPWDSAAVPQTQRVVMP